MADRFFRRGLSEIKFSATLTDTDSPFSVTRLEITNAVDLTVDIAEISGLSFSNDPIATPDLASTFTTTIPGEDTADTPVLTFYDRDENDASNLIRAALDKGATGYLLIGPYGLRVANAGRRMEIWKITSTGKNDEWSAGNDPARYAVGFAVTAEPTQDATVPA